MPQRNVATNFTFEQQRQEINLLAADFWSQKGTVDTAAPTYLKHDGSNAFTGQTLGVPNAFTINANSGGGTVTISGNLNVTGTTTTVNTTNLEITDKNILIAKGNTSDATADGAGITIDSATDITFNFVDAKDALVSSIGLEGTTFVKAPYGQFTGSGTPSAGQGIEINAPDTNTGQISSYDRGGSAYKELRIKGSSVGIYTGTANALIGTFNSTGLTTTGDITLNSTDKKIYLSNDSDQYITANAASNYLVLGTANDERLRIDSSGNAILSSTNAAFKSESSNAGDYVRMYAGAGTGKWDIYGNGANLRFSDNDSAGSVVFDRNVDANGGLDVIGDLSVSGNTTLGDSNTADTLTIKGSMIQMNDSSETDYAAKSLPSGDSGFYIRNANGGVGTYASLGIIASNGSSDQSFSIITKCTNSGLSPEVFFTQRDGNNSQRNVLKIDTNGKAVFEGDLEIDGSSKLTRINVGGQESTGNVAGNTWWKVGTWAGVGVDAAARATITVLGANTHNSNNPAGGETKIYISVTGSEAYASYYSHTDHHQGVNGVATKYTQSTSSCEIWVRYSAGYSSTSCFADVTNGTFTGESTNTNDTGTVPSGATLATSKYVLRTSNGIASDERITVSDKGTITFGKGVLEEPFHNDTGGGIQGNYSHNILDYGELFYGVTNAVADFTFNVRGDSSVAFNDITTIGKTTTVTIYVSANSKYMTEFRIDNTAQTVKWAGGSAPSSGSASGVDVYSMTIMKTAANTYHVFGNVTNFA